MERPVSFFAMLFILLFTAIGFILIVFGLKGITFVFELGLLLAFMFFLAFAMFLVYTDKSASWGVIAAVLMLLLFDISVIFLITRSFGWEYIITTIFALAGLIVALINIVSIPRTEPSVESHYDKQQYYYPLSEKPEHDEGLKEEIKKEVKREVKSELENEQKAQKIVATYTPGKYVASKKANKFHSPKCDWAKRIGKENQLWFNSEAEARAKGFEPDKCVA
ncbi:hypothetical protein HY637_01895 [Candidatus Woesearchaeota archaeon]|nr:hypothetical protein [Candidatus Woesearchaeota archaeon]